jgi:hypothetical protein
VENPMKMGWGLTKDQEVVRIKSKIMEQIFLGPKTEMEKNHWKIPPSLRRGRGALLFMGINPG